MNIQDNNKFMNIEKILKLSKWTNNEEQKAYYEAIVKLNHFEKQHLFERLYEELFTKELKKPTNMTKLTLAELLDHPSETIRRNAMSIYKTLQKIN